eukprot:TRINITY_DN897_c2_g1_i1.p1 TRINITY_DN897_c2_g1~~TRINITY_DN897_c2_g1_i1.p1  ORF type:complete len:432 (-),score=184.00 TRINITY_DN897_c2_g1_i1:152-1447(-)
MSAQFDDLEDYEQPSDDEVEDSNELESNNNNNENNNNNSEKDTYTSVHASGFKDFTLKPELLRAIGDCGFEHPSEVQSECIPQAILNTDVICQAKSGMGKTAVFVLAVLQQLDAVPGEIHVLVLCHIRELAYQIKREFDRFSKYMSGVKTGVFYGGIPISEDRKTLLSENRPNIVIGTPGRTKALVMEGTLKLKHIKHFILDECDKMLETLDMRSDVQQIFLKTPHEKQVMMFSATLSDEIKPVCQKFMHNPLEIYVSHGSDLTLHGLQQYYVQVHKEQKNRTLFSLLDSLEFNQLVIFVKTKQRAETLNQILKEGNFPSIWTHSKLPMAQRIERYQKFKDFGARILVATDLFGRGVDIERVNVVINYDMPDSADQYLHRVGRAGRFGTKGLAISFVANEEDADVLNEVQNRFTVNIAIMPTKIDCSTYMT